MRPYKWCSLSALTFLFAGSLAIVIASFGIRKTIRADLQTQVRRCRRRACTGLVSDVVARIRTRCHGELCTTRRVMLVASHASEASARHCAFQQTGVCLEAGRGGLNAVARPSRAARAPVSPHAQCMALTLVARATRGRVQVLNATLWTYESHNATVGAFRASACANACGRLTHGRALPRSAARPGSTHLRSMTYPRVLFSVLCGIGRTHDDATAPSAQLRLCAQRPRFG